jgi:hypothetical protein
VKTEDIEQRDGITRIRRERFEFPLTPEESAQLDSAINDINTAVNFDTKVAALEALATEHASETAAYGTPGWYGCRLLEAIARVREAIRSGLPAQEVAARAVDVGHYEAQAAAKGWPIVTRGRRIADGSQSGANKRGADVRANAEEVRQLLGPIVADAAQREFPTNAARNAWIARQLEATHLIALKPDTIRKILPDL